MKTNTAPRGQSHINKPENKDNLDSRVKEERNNNSNNQKDVKLHKPKANN
ncbi:MULTISPECIES: hypothetical protein [unclassified Siphonobacter]|nr:MULTISPECIES: hypothetical protein [unclassified Siphonobacter]MDQ1087587.1 hypothetical protein [Siphonobacter sp. SORGH_AS_1065]MDR6193738.1 hypothetical protein [Siphonobacter sp. SORGH_AS_0500]